MRQRISAFDGNKKNERKENSTAGGSSVTRSRLGGQSEDLERIREDLGGTCRGKGEQRRVREQFSNN